MVTSRRRSRKGGSDGWPYRHMMRGEEDYVGRRAIEKKLTCNGNLCCTLIVELSWTKWLSESQSVCNALEIRPNRPE